MDGSREQFNENEKKVIFLFADVLYFNFGFFVLILRQIPITLPGRITIKDNFVVQFLVLQ